MAQQTIGVGSAPNDTTGDPLRTAFTKCNDNFTELYAGKAPQHGRLVFVSATQVKFLPHGGDQVKINGVLYPIPSSGITAANTNVYVAGTAGQNLAASTVYLVTLFNNSGALTINFSIVENGHSTDTTSNNVGVEILNENSNHTIIGMARTNASSQFQDDSTFRGLLSWFNRRDRSLVGGGTGGTGTTSSTLVEITSAARIYFLNWADEEVFAGISGSFLSGAAGTAGAQLALDGAVIGSEVLQTIASGTWWGPGSGFMAFSASEAMHYVTVFGRGNGVTMNFYMNCAGMIRG